MSASGTIFCCLNWTCAPSVVRITEQSCLASWDKCWMASAFTELPGVPWLQSRGVQHPHSQLFSPHSDLGWQGRTSAPSQPAEGLLAHDWPLQCARESQQGGGMKAVWLESWAANSDTGCVPQLAAGYLPLSCTAQEGGEASARLLEEY